MKEDPRLGILYSDYGHSHIEGFSNADSKSDRRFITGYYIFMEGNPVSYKSKKQNIVSRFIMKFENKAMAQFTCEIL